MVAALLARSHRRTGRCWASSSGADLSLAEVARVLEVPLGTVKSGSTRRVPP